MSSRSIIAVVFLAAACGSTPRPRPAMKSTVRLGECASPDRDGVLSKTPNLKRSNRDLDGDGADEMVVADSTLCTPEGNCHWNLFAEKAGCWRFLGSLAGAGLELGSARGHGEFRDVVAWWAFGEGGRSLRQEYQYVHGAYRLQRTLTCREQDDDRLLCASEGGD